MGIKNVLFLVDRFDPYPSANGICCENVIDEFLNNDCRVFVGSYSIEKESIREAGVDSRYNTFSIGPLDNLSSEISFCKKLVQYFKWIIPFSKLPASLKLRRANTIVANCKNIIITQRIDTIICFYYPAEILFAGYELKSIFPQIRVVAYLIDPFYGGFIPSYLPKRYCDYKNRQWEELLLEKYDLPILMQSNYLFHQEQNIKSSWFSRTACLDVPYLLPNKNLVGDDEIKKEKIIVFFCGLLEHPRRNVEFIVDIIKRIHSKNIEFVFAGKTNRKDLLLSCKNITYLGEIPHDSVLNYLQAADVFLNLGVKKSSAVSGKIFEYMSFCKPIISTYSIDNEACIKYLKQYPYSFLLDERKEDIESLANQVEHFILVNQSCRVNEDYIYRTFKLNLPDQLYKTINTFVENGDCFLR